MNKDESQDLSHLVKDHPAFKVYYRAYLATQNEDDDKTNYETAPASQELLSQIYQEVNVNSDGICVDLPKVQYNETDEDEKEKVYLTPVLQISPVLVTDKDNKECLTCKVFKEIEIAKGGGFLMGWKSLFIFGGICAAIGFITSSKGGDRVIRNLFDFL